MAIMLPPWVLTSARELAALATNKREKVRVAGDSMAPTLLDGEVVLVERTRRADVGDIVVCTHPWRSVEVIKFLRSTDDGFADLWSPAGDHSAQFGRPSLAAVSGVVTFNLSRRRPLANVAGTPPWDGP